jgi:hypothetical protein
VQFQYIDILDIRSSATVVPVAEVTTQELEDGKQFASLACCFASYVFLAALVRERLSRLSSLTSLTYQGQDGQ